MIVFGRFFVLEGFISCQNGVRVLIIFRMSLPLFFCICPRYFHRVLACYILSYFVPFSDVLLQIHPITHNAQHTSHTHETHTDTQTLRHTDTTHNTQHTTHNIQHTTHNTQHTSQRCVKTVDPMWSGCWSSPVWICLLSYVSTVIQLPALPWQGMFVRHVPPLCFDSEDWKDCREIINKARVTELIMCDGAWLMNVWISTGKKQKKKRSFLTRHPWILCWTASWGKDTWLHKATMCCSRSIF